jgi:hypothetical protein
MGATPPPDTGDSMSADTATTTEAPPATEPQAADTAATDPSAEVEKWKNLARKHEERAKANAKAQAELDQLREASASEQDRAIAAARKEAATEAAKNFGSKLAEAQFRVAAAGLLDRDQLDGLLEVVDLTRFVDDNGDPDIDAITAAVSRVAPKSVDQGIPPDDHQGSRTPPALNGDGLERALRSKLGI